ncbi:MAG: hypothetical protein ACHQ53_18560, partial [Polyangiales bacterium]
MRALLATSLLTACCLACGSNYRKPISSVDAGVSGAGVGAMFPGASLDAGTLPATSGFMSFPMVLDGGFGIGPCSMC